jgi:hypothetical protein
LLCSSVLLLLTLALALCVAIVVAPPLVRTISRLRSPPQEQLLARIEEFGRVVRCTFDPDTFTARVEFVEVSMLAHTTAPL